MDYHQQQVSKIAAKITGFHRRKQPYRIYHGNTNSTRKVLFDTDNIIDTSQLDNVLNIDLISMTALVEPNVSVETLVQKTFALGVMPKVVPEFPSITIGGAFSGMAAESSSFTHGLLDDTVSWVEFIMAGGAVVELSEKSMPEVFHGAARTFGTLGTITLLRVSLVDALPFVELTYHPVSSVAEHISKMREVMNDQNTLYVDGIIFGESQGVVITGCLTGTPRPGLEVRTFRRSEDEWFYIHAKHFIAGCENGMPRKLTVPLMDYFFRYDRGAFWAAKHVFTYFAVPFNEFTRWLFDPFMDTKTLYHGLHENGMAKDNIIQDVVVPLNKAQELIEWIHETWDIHPLWVCPIRPSINKSMFPTQISEQANSGMLISIGLWGPRLPNPLDFVAENRKLEHRLTDMMGMKWLYAQCYYTEHEFWNVYDKVWYDKLRRTCNAEYLPDVYQKTKFDWQAEQKAINSSWMRWLFSFVWFIWPVPGIYGVLRVLTRSKYLLAK
ncbi:MAG: hypothetical protein M1831_006342 [Alyxoria varia]|nr:MAG: hypothetical protein M1831_006342 [Alyxoria varia]